MGEQNIETLIPGLSLQDNKYIIRNVLGKGGFGITYLADFPLMDSTVAIKELFIKGLYFRESGNSSIISTSMNDIESGFFRNKFVDEARTLAKFKHANIVRVTDIFEENNTAYYTMEYIQGYSLQDEVSEKGTVPIKQSLAYMNDILSAVDTVHAQGVLHRDIKPTNIMISDDGTPVLIDFGAAKGVLSDKGKTEMPLLTRGYAPIEQYSVSREKGFYTDIYSLGATFYYMFTGKNPVESIDRDVAVMPDPIEINPDVSRDINEFILKAMEIKPEKRFQSTKVMLRVLMDIMKEFNAKPPVSDLSGKSKIFRRAAFPEKNDVKSREDLSETVFYNKGVIQAQPAAISSDFKNTSGIPGSASKANICGNCGHNNKPASRFCSICGKKISVKPASECQKCGTMLRTGVRFCSKCGFKCHED